MKLAIQAATAAVVFSAIVYVDRTAVNPEITGRTPFWQEVIYPLGATLVVAAILGWIFRYTLFRRTRFRKLWPFAFWSTLCVFTIWLAVIYFT